MRRVYVLVAWVPLVLWGLALRYLGQLEGWGAWGAAGPLLVPIVGLSAGLGAVGAVLWWRAHRRGESAAGIGLATGVASVVALYYAARALV